MWVAEDVAELTVRLVLALLLVLVLMLETRCMSERDAVSAKWDR